MKNPLAKFCVAVSRMLGARSPTPTKDTITELRAKADQGNTDRNLLSGRSAVQATGCASASPKSPTAMFLARHISACHLQRRRRQELADQRAVPAPGHRRRRRRRSVGRPHLLQLAPSCGAAGRARGSGAAAVERLEQRRRRDVEKPSELQTTSRWAAELGLRFA